MDEERSLGRIPSIAVCLDVMAQASFSEVCHLLLMNQLWLLPWSSGNASPVASGKTASLFSCQGPFGLNFSFGTLSPPTSLFPPLRWWNKGNVYCSLIELFSQNHLGEFGFSETESWKTSFLFCFLISFICHQMHWLRGLLSTWMGGGRHRNKKGGGLKIKGSWNQEVILGRKVSEAQNTVSV